MKNFEFVKILQNGVPMIESIRDSFITYKIYTEEDGMKTVLVQKEDEKWKINGIEVKYESNVIWCQKGDLYFKVSSEEVFTYNEKLELLDEKPIWEVKKDALDAAFSCKTLFPENSAFHHNLLDNLNLKAEMKKWFKMNMTGASFQKEFNENMKDKEILSYFKFVQTFMEFQDMYDTLITRKTLDPALHLMVISLSFQKTDMIQLLKGFFKKKKVPMTILMDAMLMSRLSDTKKKMLQSLLDEKFFGDGCIDK